MIRANLVFCQKIRMNNTIKFLLKTKKRELIFNEFPYHTFIISFANKLTHKSGGFIKYEFMKLMVAKITKVKITLAKVKIINFAYNTFHKFHYLADSFFLICYHYSSLIEKMQEFF